MKILFMGLGSIGSRHVKNLTKILSDRHNIFEIHAIRATSRELPMEIKHRIAKQFCDIQYADACYDIVFITNPTYLHFDTLKSVLGRAKKIFLEKPVFDSLNVDLASIVFPSDTICYVAAPMRFTRVYEWLRDFVLAEKIYNARSICSSYLPDWRPGSDYRNCYSADKSKGGDIGLELIHEWDYLTSIFGMPESISVVSGKFSHLEITSDDVALYIARYPDKVVSVQLDYFGRYSRREIELYCRDDVVVADFVKGEIRFLKSGQRISLAEERDSYQIAELKYFLSLNNEIENSNSVEHAFDVLKLAKGVLP